MNQAEGDGKKIYARITGKKYLITAISIVAVFLFFILDMMTGPSWLSAQAVVNTLLFPGSADPSQQIIVWNLRLPIACMALLVGASMGIAGAEMQTILDNALADPYTLGISSAAGFGAGLAIVLGIGIAGTGALFITINAFVFSLASSLLIYFIARMQSSGKGTILLCGIALLFLFQSSLAFLEYISSNQEMAAILFWLFGNLYKTTWTGIFTTSTVMLITFLVFSLDAWKLTALKLGDNKASSLGVNVQMLRRKVLVFTSLLTAVAVSFVGTIGFIGLVGPHIARMTVGDDQRFFLVNSALMGAALLSVSSTVSKLVTPGMIFPIGIITSFIGVPFFFLLIIKYRRVIL